MLVVTPLGPGAAAYFLDGTGRWEGGGCAELGLEGAVGGADLRAVLRGQHPRHGRPLTRRVPHRRAGWDLTFAAPKSLSLVAALAGADEGGVMRAAHAAAVSDALGWLALHVCRVGPGGDRTGVAGVVLASFEHSTSDAGDPHVHTHVLLANAALESGGGWRALGGTNLWPTMRPLGGVYRSALRSRLERAGLGFSWRMRPDGLGELAGVPPAAVLAASARVSEVKLTLGSWDDPELATRRVRRLVRAVTRSGQPPPAGEGKSPGPPGPDWQARVSATGWGRPDAAALLAASRARPGSAPARERGADLHAAVVRWLAARSSTFSALDVARAVAAVDPAGMAPHDLDAVVARVCGRPDPYVAGRRWTTPEARAGVEAVVGMASAPHRVGVPEPLAAVALDAHSLPPGAATEARRLVASPGTAVVLGGRPGVEAFFEQACVLAAASAAWTAAGHSVAVACAGAARRRWDALTGLTASGQRAGPGVLVVDRADRVPPPELQRLVAGVSALGGKAVLVEGGTLPALRHPCSDAIAGIGRGRDGWWAGLEAEMGAGRRAGWVTAGSLTLGFSPLDAMAAAVGRWGDAAAGRRPQLVGLGPAEVAVLNRLARRRLALDGALGGPSLTVAGREFCAGDEVIALRRVGVPAGARGSVEAADTHAGTLRVRWAGGRPALLDRHDARRVGHAYAVVPGRASRGQGPVLVVGDPRHLDRLGPVVSAAALTAPAPPPGTPGLLDTLIATGLGTTREQRQGGGRPGAPAPQREPSETFGPGDTERRRAVVAARLLAGSPPLPATPAGREVVARWAEANSDDIATYLRLGYAAALNRSAQARAAAARAPAHGPHAAPTPGPAGRDAPAAPHLGLGF